MNDPRVLQVYPESEDMVSNDSGTQQITFGSDPVIDETISIICDYYAKQRSNIGDDMAVLLPGIDAIRNELKTEHCPPFSEKGIKTFQWRWERVIFEYGAPELKYLGARFYIIIRTFSIFGKSGV